jgi:hypothetical protein
MYSLLRGKAPLTVLDQVLVTQTQEGLNCSLFEAQALFKEIRDVCFSWSTRRKRAGLYRFPYESQRIAILRKLCSNRWCIVDVEFA